MTATRATANAEKRARIERQRALDIRRDLDMKAQIAGMINFDTDIPKWEDRIIADAGEDWALPFWRVLQGFKALALENASLRRMMRN